MAASVLGSSSPKTTVSMVMTIVEIDQGALFAHMPTSGAMYLIVIVVPMVAKVILTRLLHIVSWTGCAAACCACAVAAWPGGCLARRGLQLAAGPASSAPVRRR